MKHCVHFVVCICFLVVTTLIYSQAICPKCYFDQGPLPGHGETTPENPPRTRLKVSIDPQGAAQMSSSEQSNATGAFGEAADAWNVQTDGAGHPTHYFLQ